MVKTTTEAERLVAANALIETIASKGLRFFAHKGRVSRLELDSRGRVWLIDKFTQKRVYTHYRWEWRGFSEGGTLRAVIEALRDFIKRETQMTSGFGPWPKNYCNGNLWGYGDDMAEVRGRAIELGVLSSHA